MGAVLTGPIHINHVLFRDTRYSGSTDSNYNLQHLIPICKQGGGNTRTPVPLEKTIITTHKIEEALALSGINQITWEVDDIYEIVNIVDELNSA